MSMEVKIRCPNLDIVVDLGLTMTIEDLRDYLIYMEIIEDSDLWHFKTVCNGDENLKLSDTIGGLKISALNIICFLNYASPKVDVQYLNYALTRLRTLKANSTRPNLRIVAYCYMPSVVGQS
jgi:hypothetical protein